ETSLEDRAGLFASTILSGDYLGDDDPDDLTINKTDNASTVVQALGAIGAELTGFGLDGFIVSGGNGGSGMYMINTDAATLTNMLFWGNSAGSVAVADIYSDSSFTLTDSCGDNDLSSYNSIHQQISANPLVEAASGQLFLDQSTACVDNGDHDITGEDPAMTTSLDGTADSGMI
ncbi:MAG: hypothetical protein GY820_02760, partial [Gammaproteobacteria bacterium]|nr:hypothetical protein [Gammaproteobacteria bacterium]